MPGISIYQSRNAATNLLNILEKDTKDLKKIIDSGEYVTIKKVDDLVLDINHRLTAINSRLNLLKLDSKRFNTLHSDAKKTIAKARKILKRLILNGSSLNDQVIFSESWIKPRHTNRWIRLLLG